MIKARLLKGTKPLVSVIPKSSMTVLHDHHETNVSDGRMSLVTEHDPHRFPITMMNGMLGKQSTAREGKSFKIIKPSQIKIDRNGGGASRKDQAAAYGGYEKPQMSPRVSQKQGERVSDLPL